MFNFVELIIPISRSKQLVQPKSPALRDVARSCEQAADANAEWEELQSNHRSMALVLAIDSMVFHSTCMP